MGLPASTGGNVTYGEAQAGQQHLGPQHADVEGTGRQASVALPHSADRVAEAEKPKDSKTRTWFDVKDQPVFAWAGLWRISDEWDRSTRV